MTEKIFKIGLLDLIVWSLPIVILLTPIINFDLTMVEIIIMIIITPLYMVYEMNKEIGEYK